MLYQLNRHIIEIPDADDDDSEKLTMDFFLYPEKRKIILGTVRFPNGTPAPNALVKVARLKNGCSNTKNLTDIEDTTDVEDIGHAITNDSGEFIIGPVYPGDTIILKIAYMEETDREALVPYKTTHSPEDNL